MLQTTSYKWIAFAVLVMVMQIAATSPGFNLEFQDDHFLVEGIFQTQALESADAPEFIVSGKNYTGRDMYLYLLTVGPDFKPAIQWQSENLFEERSTLGVTVGKFTAPERQILAISQTNFYLYQFTKEKPFLAIQGRHKLDALNIASADLNGDGRDELITAVVGQVTNTSYQCRVRVWKFENNQFALIAQSGLMGNIRSLTAGDLDGDGSVEIVVEEGLRAASGNLHILSLTNNNQFVEEYNLKKATQSAAYGIKIRSFPEGIRLIAATANGKINFFKWSNRQLVPTGAELSFSSGLVDADALDLNGDLLPELLIICYPQRFLILRNLGGIN